MDAALSALVVLAALGFLVQRFRGRKTPKAKPNVIVGQRLAQAMKRGKA